jgi:hypothetical protein
MLLHPIKLIPFLVGPAMMLCGTWLHAQVPDTYQATDELEFYEDYYLQDESFERRFLGTDDDLDEIGDELEIERYEDSADAVDFGPDAYRDDVYRDSDELEPYGKADFLRQYEVPSQYIDRSDESRDLVPESYGYPYSLEHPHAPVTIRRNSPQWYQTYYPYERFSDSVLEDDLEVEVADDQLELDADDWIEPSPEVYDRDIDVYNRDIDVDVEAGTQPGLLYDDPDDEFWYERGESPATVETWSDSDVFGVD